jgi:hypothetical protein
MTRHFPRGFDRKLNLRGSGLVYRSRGYLLAKGGPGSTQAGATWRGEGGKKRAHHDAPL